MKRDVSQWQLFTVSRKENLKDVKFHVNIHLNFK